MNRPVILEAQNLKKTFRTGFWRKKVNAVRSVSFEIRQGEIFGLVGPNGAGKTTTMKMLTGLIFPDGGEMKMFGEPVDHVQVRARLGYLPENPYFYEHLTARELILYYGSLHGLSRALVRERAEALLEDVGLEHASDRPIRKFSKGMRQRVGIAQALINDPDLVILDEPQSGLDPVGRKEVRDLIFRLKQAGKTVFFSSHILPDVEAVCDRVAVMHQGIIRKTGSLSELTSEQATSYEVLVRNLAANPWADFPGVLNAELRGDLTALHLSADVDLNAVLREISQNKGVLHSVIPQEDNLEDVFLRDTDALITPDFPTDK